MAVTGNEIEADDELPVTSSAAPDNESESKMAPGGSDRSSKRRPGDYERLAGTSTLSLEEKGDVESPGSPFQKQTVATSGRAAEVVADDAESRKKLEKNFWKNVIVISLGFMFLFMGYYPVSAVQTSLNDAQGLGTAALSAKYASMAFGNLFTNNFVVDRIGCKWALSLGMLMYSSYIAANFYPTWGTLIPFGILSGLGGGFMWMAQGTYLTRLCDAYSALKGKNVAQQAKLKSWVFGLFNCLYFGSNALGNLASSLILPQEDASDITSERLAICGAQYCHEDLDDYGSSTNETSTTFPSTSVTEALVRHSISAGLQLVGSDSDSTSGSSKPDQAHVYGLCGFCLGSALIGVCLMVTLVDRLPGLGISERIKGNTSMFYLFGATIRHWRNPIQLMLIPLGMYNGMDNPFWSADFTKAFVTCPIGIHYVGYVMMFYGVAIPINILLFSWFGKTRFRFVPYLIGLAAHIAVLITMLKWMPDPDQLPGVDYGLSVVWGIGSGVWYPLLSAFYSIIFRDNMEAAFSNFHLWSTLGSSLTYAWSYSLCINAKVYIMMSILIVGVICYLIVEYHLLVRGGRSNYHMCSTENDRPSTNYQRDINPNDIGPNDQRDKDQESQH